MVVFANSFGLKDIFNDPPEFVDFFVSCFLTAALMAVLEAFPVLFNPLFYGNDIFEKVKVKQNELLSVYYLSIC